MEAREAGQKPADSSWAEKYKEIWIITGPVYDDEKECLACGVEIPDEFYKIVLDVEEQTGKPRAVGFIMPNEKKVKEPLTTYLVSVDEVEKKTGLDFFSKLDDEVESQLESKKASSLWP